MSNASPQDDSKPRVTNACEACRAAKVKCTASTQLGICRRCLDSKRECIFKTGPRTRRPRQSRLNNTSAPLSPPPGPSKTFTIDIPLQVDDDLVDSFETLRDSHEMYIDNLVPAETADSSQACPFSQPSSSSSATAFQLPTPPTSTTSRPMSMLSIQPQFNLDSASQLLQSFRGMLPHFPCILLLGDASVSSLAKERPFVLLAILAAASGSRTLQGHCLYDDEFRKILGLKFVAGGERTLELLQGLLVYCAWYPSHLRPKNKQAFQYIRMAVDIVHDLELDQEPEDFDMSESALSGERLAGIRAYLACYYLSSSRASTWQGSSALHHTQWFVSCCDRLEANAAVSGDRVLPWLVRYQRIIEETFDLRKLERNQAQNGYQIGLMIKGMESQIREWRSKIPSDISVTPVRIADLFTEIFLYGSSLFKLPKFKAEASQRLDLSQDPQRLMFAIPVLRKFFDYVASLRPAELASFCGVDWGRFVICVVLCFRMSFPIPTCPGWDSESARRELDLGTYLSRLCQEESSSSLTSATNVMDIHSASKVVLGVVKRKFEKRVASLSPSPMEMDKTLRGCPMLDGSMEPYFQMWDETFVDPSLVARAGTPTSTGPPMVFHDLWATMTMGWTQGGMNMDDINFDSM